MKPPAFFDQLGNQIALGNLLGTGGEASVFQLANDPKIVAKVYHRPPEREKEEKVLKMLALGTERLLRLSAWPIGVLHPKGNSRVAGVLMRNIGSYKDIHQLYNPKSRLREFPARANWPFLIHTAGNIARAFSVIHEHGHVIGDVNESNIRVSPNSAFVSLIDCDSFQIFSEGRYFLCGVGVPLYTPPELQEKDFSTVVRTPNQDNFGLAVMIFNLLFMGRHPFAGKFSGKGDMPIERAISEFRFAFAPDVGRTLMQPPPNCITLAHVSPHVAELFVRAFSPGGVQNGRPTAKQWVEALTYLGEQLKDCTINRAHRFFKTLPVCPWCFIESHSGVLLFVATGVSDLQSGFRLEFVWAQIQSIPAPGTAPMPNFQHTAAGVRPTPQALAAGWKRRFQIGAAILIVAAIVVGAVAAGVGSAAIWLGIISIAIARSALKNTGDTKRRFESEVRAVEARVNSLTERWHREASEEKFSQKLTALKELRKQHLDLPNLRQTRLRVLEADRYKLQLRHYLEKYQISSASIPHIGDARKAMLSSFGIDTAADINGPAVEGVPGFGTFLTEQLNEWRRSLERRFVFDPKRGVDPEDIRALDREIAARRTELEKALLLGPSQLNEARTQVFTARQRLQSELQKCWGEVFQARANLGAA